MARAKDTVVVGYCHPTEVATGFSESLLDLHLWDARQDRRRVVGRIPRYSSANVSNARNGIVRHFLTGTADWLLMLDADMTFSPTLVEDLLANASATRAPVVGALCFGVEDGALFPTLYGVTEDDQLGIHMVRYHQYPPRAMFQVAATGAACLLIHRTVLERVQEAEAAKGNTAYPWFQETALNGQPCGEDVTFCLRVGALGLPVYVDTSVAIGHQKSHTLVEDQYRDQHPEHLLT